MQPPLPSRRWTLGVMLAFVIIDVLMATRIIERLILHTAPIAPDGPVFFMLLVALQVILLRRVSQLRLSIEHYQRLKYHYDQELDLSRQLMETAQEGLAVLNEHGKLVYANAAFTAFMGQDMANLLGRTVQEWLPTAPEPFWESPTPLVLALSPTQQVQLRSQVRWHGGRKVGHIVSLLALTSEHQVPSQG